MNGTYRVRRKVCSNDREHLDHRCKRHVALLIVRVVVSPADITRDADDQKSRPVQRDEFTDRWTAGKQQLRALLPQDDHFAPLVHIGAVDEPAVFHGEEANYWEVWFDTHHLAARAGILAHLLDVSVGK